MSITKEKPDMWHWDNRKGAFETLQLVARYNPSEASGCKTKNSLKCFHLKTDCYWSDMFKRAIQGREAEGDA